MGGPGYRAPARRVDFPPERSPYYAEKAVRPRAAIGSGIVAARLPVGAPR